MCNPRVIPGPHSIGMYVDAAETNWNGPIQMYEVLSPFLFASDEGVCESLPTLHAFSTLRDDKQAGGREAVFRFIQTVHARTVAEMARSHPEYFVRQWCATDKGTYEEWDTLEENCLAREDLDLMYVGFTPRKFSPITPSFVYYFLRYSCYRHYLPVAKRYALYMHYRSTYRGTRKGTCTGRVQERCVPAGDVGVGSARRASTNFR